MTSIDRQALEFLNQNMHRNYPLQDTQVVVSEDGVYLPSSFLVDLKMSIPCKLGDSNINAANFFVSAVNHYSASVQVVISYQYDAEHSFECACSPAIVTADGSYPEVVTLTPAAGIPADTKWDPLRNLTGELWIGSTQEVANVSSLKFTYEHAAINPTLITKIVRVDEIMSSVTVLVGDDVLGTISGEMKLKAGAGIAFVLDTNTNELTIKLDETWLSEQIQEIMATEVGTPLKSINGITPDSEGNLSIGGMDCTEVNNVAYGITISNPCSRPCCGDESGDVADIQASQGLLKDQVERLTQSLNAFIISLNNVETRLPSLVASRK
jgi:hypothetical protein